jgi:hypothetical protein
MSFAEKVHNRLLALENQVKALDQRRDERHDALLEEICGTDTNVEILRKLISDLDQRLKALEPQKLEQPFASVKSDEALREWLHKSDPVIPIKRKPGRPKKVVNG